MARGIHGGEADTENERIHSPQMLANAQGGPGQCQGPEAHASSP